MTAARGTTRTLTAAVALVAVLLATSRDAGRNPVGPALLAASCFVLIAGLWYHEARRVTRRDAAGPPVVLTALRAAGVATAMLGVPALAFFALFLMLGGFHLLTDHTLLDRPGESLATAAIALLAGALPVALALRRIFWPVNRDTQPSQP